MIEIKNLYFSHDGKVIIRDLTLNIPTGTGIRLFGPNGVGKSTLVNLIVGQLNADSGEIRLDSRNLQDFPKQELFKLISVMAQATQADSMILASDLLKHLNVLNRADSIVSDLDLSSTLQTPVAKLSGGQKQRLFFVLAIAKLAKIYIFDEPISNQDEAGQELIERKVKELIESGKTVIVISHSGFDDLPTFEL